MTALAVEKKTNRPTCERPSRWPIELGLLAGEQIDFKAVWKTFTVGIATPVDFGTRFRMIHGDLHTRSKRGESGGCRLQCGCPQEKHIHLVQCPKILPLWQKIRAILEGARGKPFKCWQQTIILGWSTQEGPIEKGSVAMLSILLKVIVIAWVLVLHRNKPFRADKVWRIFWTRAQMHWEELVRDKEKEIRNIILRKSNPRSTIKGINKQLAPLGKVATGNKIVCHIEWHTHSNL